MKTEKHRNLEKIRYNEKHINKQRGRQTDAQIVNKKQIYRLTTKEQNRARRIHRRANEWSAYGKITISALIYLSLQEVRKF